MASKTSRREILVAGVAALASTAAGAQEPKKEEAPVDTSGVEKQLAKPLDDRAKKLLKASVRNSQNASTERMKFKLPENSEPCTMYVPTQVAKR